VDEIAALLQDASVRVPERIIMPTAQGAVLFVMPACDRRIAMTKLITLTPANARRCLPSRATSSCSTCSRASAG
jgi:ornithine cyclodeaminase